MIDSHAPPRGGRSDHLYLILGRSSNCRRRGGVCEEREELLKILDMRDPRAIPPRTLPDAGYAALFEGAALVDLSHKTILRLVGKEAVGMLNAILTNEVPEEERRGVYALLLNPKGRIQADLRVLKSDGDFLIDTEPEGTAATKELLGRYAPFSRVEVEDLSEADPAC